jgi:hypothetical protein
MKIINPENAGHEFTFIPRVYFEGEVLMELYNEETSTTLSYELTPVTTDGYVYVAFEQEFTNNSNYQIRIFSGDTIVYRGKMFVTNQADDLQEYKITKDVFTL